MNAVKSGPCDTTDLNLMLKYNRTGADYTQNFRFGSIMLSDSSADRRAGAFLCS